MFFSKDKSTGLVFSKCKTFPLIYLLTKLASYSNCFSISMKFVFINIDFFSLSSTSDGELIKQIFSGANMVPVLSTISMSFIPMYSRREMMNGGVKNWLNGTSRSEGLL